MRHYLKFFLVFILELSMIGAFGQEYDDLYFTKKDRVKQKKKFNELADQVSKQPSQTDKELSFLGRQFQYDNPSIDEVEVSEESLNYYKPDKTPEDYQIHKEYGADNQYLNPNFGDPQATYYDNTVPQQVIVNNYYNDNWNGWNSPRWRFGLGWNSWNGNFWSASYGNSFGNYWYDPFRNPWYNTWGSVGGWNSWGWRGGFYDPYWCPPGYYGNYYRRPAYVAVTDRESGRRDVVRGARPSRGSVSSGESRSSSGRRTEVASEVNSSSRQADYNRQQTSYLNRSRSSRYNSGTSRGSSSVSSRSGNTNTNSSTFNNSGRRSNTNSNSNGSNNNTRSRSYSPPASSSGRSSSVRSSSPSRSSSSVSRSRNSSSSRSSGSRSSSGRSRSKRRGGN